MAKVLYRDDPTEPHNPHAAPRVENGFYHKRGKAFAPPKSTWGAKTSHGSDYDGHVGIDVLNEAKSD